MNERRARAPDGLHPPDAAIGEQRADGQNTVDQLVGTVAAALLGNVAPNAPQVALRAKRNDRPRHRGSIRLVQG